MEKEDEFSIKCCRICGAEKEWTTCWQCGGDGGYDEYEDDPVNFAPGQEWTTCGSCKGEGGYLECVALPHSDELINEFLKLTKEADRQYAILHKQ